MQTTAFFLLGLAALASATSYHRYKVVSVIPKTEVEADLIRGVVSALDLQQWTDPKALGVPVDIMVPPQHIFGFLSGMRRHGIKASIKISDVQKIIDDQAASRKTPKELLRTFDHTSYHSYDEINSILDGAVNEFPHLLSVYTAGTTYEGRQIHVAKVSTTNDDSKSAIWIDCGIHAREWISPATCQWILDKLTSGYGSDSEVTAVLDAYDFHIMPSTNPDGYAFTWSNDRLWRKNRSPSHSSVGCHGTDVNRNFDSDFGGPGTSDYPCSDIYHGESAFSEKESQAVKDSIDALGNRAAMYVTFHSFSQLWMTPYGYTYSTPPNYDEQYRVAGVGVKALQAVHGTQYTYGNIASTIYLAAGGSSDWAYDGAGIRYSFAIELRDKGHYGFLLPAEQIVPVGEETWAGLLAAINAM